MTNSPVIDHETADTLRRMAGLEGYIAILVSFQENVEAIFAALSHAFNQKNMIQVREEGHALKGVAGNIGATQLAKYAQHIEQATQLADAQPFYTQLPVLFTQSLSELRKKAV